MIIKKSLKTVMPRLKRYRVGDVAGDDEESSANRKKRKLANGYYSMRMLGDVAAGIIPFNGYGLQKILSSSSSSTAAEDCGAATEISWCADAPKSQENPRPPLVRTSRGRVQVLPSRFNDSILDNWKKEKSNGKNEVKDSTGDSEYLPIKEKDNKFIFKTPKIRGHAAFNKKAKEDKISNQCRKFSPLSEDEIEELRSDGWKSYNFRKYSSSRSSMTSLNEGLEDEEELEELMELYRIDRAYCFEDFDEGDIVWALPGKKVPSLASYCY